MPRHWRTQRTQREQRQAAKAAELRSVRHEFDEDRESNYRCLHCGAGHRSPQGEQPRCPERVRQQSQRKEWDT